MEEAHHVYFELTEYPGSLKHPPHLTFQNVTIEPYSVDWKSDSHREFSDRMGEPPSSIPVTEAESVQFTLSGSVLPSQLHVAVYHGAASKIAPLSQPDHTLMCTDVTEEPCHLEMVQGSVVFEISKELFPADLRGVLGISAEYLAQPELNSERFVNLINWAVELSPK